jgi:hypothetical protein
LARIRLPSAFIVGLLGPEVDWREPVQYRSSLLAMLNAKQVANFDLNSWNTEKTLDGK